MEDSVFGEGRVAVVTGAASGIGLAACERFAAMGMHVCMADVDAEGLEDAQRRVSAAGAGSGATVLARVTDVSDPESLRALKEAAYDELGEVAVLMNNAASFKREQALGDGPGFRQAIDTNLFGVVEGVRTFVPAMVAQATQCIVVNTGSKQGITMPPGNAVYNVAKAAVKAYTEALQHELRNTEGCQVSAHLLVPGWTTTRGREHQPGAWLPGQVIDFMLDAIGRGEFYILCPDGQVTPELDRKRILWTAGDIVHNRPPLSRWHPDYKDEFEAFCR